MNYLDKTGLTYLWSKITAKLNGKASKKDIPTNNNQLTNGAGYQTASDVDTKIANAITTALNTEV